jgi:hypothetical protein
VTNGSKSTIIVWLVMLVVHGVSSMSLFSWYPNSNTGTRSLEVKQIEPSNARIWPIARVNGVISITPQINKNKEIQPLVSLNQALDSNHIKY